MKKNKLLLLFVVLFLITGCTRILKDADGKIVKNETTGLNIVENILCLPNDEEALNTYEKALEDKKNALKEKLDNNEITKKNYEKEMDNIPDIKSLNKCSKFTITSGSYEGIWNTSFVKPLAWIMIELGM